MANAAVNLRPKNNVCAKAQFTASFERLDCLNEYLSFNSNLSILQILFIKIFKRNSSLNEILNIYIFPEAEKRGKHLSMQKLGKNKQLNYTNIKK